MTTNAAVFVEALMQRERSTRNKPPNNERTHKSCKVQFPTTCVTHCATPAPTMDISSPRSHNKRILFQCPIRLSAYIWLVFLGSHTQTRAPWTPVITLATDHEICLRFRFSKSVHRHSFHSSGYLHEPGTTTSPKSENMVTLVLFAACTVYVACLCRGWKKLET
jgi:hypothetical protein